MIMMMVMIKTKGTSTFLIDMTVFVEVELDGMHNVS